LNARWFRIILKFIKVRYGKNLRLIGVPVIYNSKGACMSIGDDCIIKSSFFSNMVGLYSRSIIVTRTPEAEIYIGNNVGLSGVTIYARKKITISDNTQIGANTKILDNDFHPLEAEARNRDDKSYIRAKPILIGKNCFIGCNAMILKGTELGDGCVVGAGAVVCGKFPANCIVAGNPARIIRTIAQ